MNVEFVIKGRLDGLNEYTRACRCNKYAGASLKKKNEDIIKIAAYHALKNEYGFDFSGILSGKVHIKFKWYEKNKRRDQDNIAFAKKFILDALVDMQLLKGDSWKYTAGFTDEFYIDKDNPRIEVYISEVE